MFLQNCTATINSTKAYVVCIVIYIYICRMCAYLVYVCAPKYEVISYCKHLNGRIGVVSLLRIQVRSAF